MANEVWQNGQSSGVVDGAEGLEITARWPSSSESVTGDASGRRDKLSALRKNFFVKISVLRK